MLLNLIRDVITDSNNSKKELGITPLMIMSPMPRVRIEWDDEEGKIKIKEKKKSVFDPRQY